MILVLIMVFPVAEMTTSTTRIVQQPITVQQPQVVQPQVQQPMASWRAISMPFSAVFLMFPAVFDAFQRLFGPAWH